MLALNIAVGGTIVFTLLAVFASQRRDALAALRQEQAKAENLLLNILPRSIADKLKAQTQPIADQFGSASILFADVVDFTPWSERLPPAEVVGYLDHLFSHFDELAERYGLEKIKTIGDCYMVAAGVPTPRPDHARALALMALDMLEAMRSDDEVGHLGLELRVGINSGPVVAGVIGRKRFLYDLWGDAVNTASRMESHGTPGRIQITRATYELLADEFECEPRGTIAVKGKGEVEAWYPTTLVLSGIPWRTTWKYGSAATATSFGIPAPSWPTAWRSPRRRASRRRCSPALSATTCPISSKALGSTRGIPARDRAAGGRSRSATRGARGYRSALLEAGTAMGRLQLAAYALADGASGVTFYDDEVSAFLRTQASPMLVTTVGVPGYRPRLANAAPRCSGYGSSSPGPRHGRTRPPRQRARTHPHLSAPTAHPFHTPSVEHPGDNHGEHRSPAM